MSEWPALEDPELRQRLALSDAEFREYVLRLMASFPPRPFEPELLEHALGYPWERPAGSYLLDAAGEAVPLSELGGAERAELVRTFTGPGARRLPLLAIGSNAAPDQLVRKFAHFEEAEDRTVPVLAGRLHDFDVGAAAQPTLYGSLPATIFPSPGTRVATALTWVTPALTWVTPVQFTQLTWTEVSYSLGRLDARFEVGDAGPAPGVFDGVPVFVSRFGAFTVDGAPVALAAVPAEGRTATALSQRELMDAAAVLSLGAGADAEALLRAGCEDMGALEERVVATVWPRGEPFASERWTPFPELGPAGDT